jgi:hypothetical protein
VSVLVDTPIWSYSLRSKGHRFQRYTDELVRLIKDHRALIIGPIRQEILSGYSDARQYSLLREKLAPFENTPIVDADYELAAEFSNRCRTKGVQGSHTDFLICAVVARLDVPVFTTDKDFMYYRKHLPIVLHEIKRS